METIADYSALRTRLRAMTNSPAIIAIEGFTTAGKSYLADSLGEDFFGSVVLHTDDYVTGTDETLPYIDRIDYRRLRRALAAASSGTVLIDGICLRAVMRRLGITPTAFVYVKCIAAKTGLWHDGLHLEDFESEKDGADRLFEPHRSDFFYHTNERPHERADVVYCHFEPSDPA